VDRLIADTGFLVAFGRAADPLHGASARFLKGYSGALITVAPVVVEAGFFLAAKAKGQLLEWIHAGGLGVVDIPVAAYPQLAVTIGKYENLDIDLADAALLWLAAETGLRKILTVDVRDFSAYRIQGRKRFELIHWY
jgi:uncharacterized protein